MKILLGWQLGSGQGHIQRLVALAEKLEAYGHTPIFALKSYDLKGIDFPWQRLEPPELVFSGREASFTFSDVLATFGFDEVSLLRSHLAAWQKILRDVNPALVITDHAPGLVLAAQTIAPTIVIGSPFAVPPPIETFPLIRCPAPPESLERQQRVSDVIHQLSSINAPLGKLLTGDRSFIFSLPPLDWYAFWRVHPTYVSAHITPIPFCHTQLGQTQLGQTQLSQTQTDPTRMGQSQHANQVWSYLAADYPLRDLVLTTLRPTVDFKPMQEALRDKGLAIHHGGLTTSIACLLAGIPQLVLPRYIEQQLTTIGLQQLGVTQTLVNPTIADLHIAQVRALALTANAQAQAQHLAPWNRSFLPVVLDACLEYLS